MPIRMEKDEQQPRRERNNPQPSQPGGGLSKFLPFILLFLFKKPKLILPVLIIGAILYFMSGGDFFNQFLGPAAPEEGGGGDLSEFSMGFDPNQEEYDKRLVYASLADSKNSMPSRVSLIQYAQI
ncbi:MAG: hypothetical protein AAFP82_10850, partial [Bacteroidota bacterium]